MAATATVSTGGCTLSMSGSAGIGTVVMIFFLNRTADVHNTQARLTGTFQLSNSSHDNLLN